MKLPKVLETLNRRVEWLKRKLDSFQDGEKDTAAWHYLHQEYVATQEANRIVASAIAAQKPEKAC